jgi:hypothetical protein
MIPCRDGMAPRQASPGRMVDGKIGRVPRSPILRPLGGTSLAIAIRGGGCEGARGRDRRYDCQ